MKSYYAFEATIRYYGRLPKTIEAVRAGESGTPGDLRGTLENEPVDASRWKEPPHYVLANLQIGQTANNDVHLADDQRKIESFIKKYGPLRGQSTHLKPKDGFAQFHESIRYFKSFQDVLRRAWAGEVAAVNKIGSPNPNFNKQLPDDLTARIQTTLLGLRESANGVTISLKNKSIEVNIGELQRVICILFLRDYGASKTGVCANPDCPAPYFLLDRKGQQFCTHKCAVLINVRKFRERKALRKRKRKTKGKTR